VVPVIPDACDGTPPVPGPTLGELPDPLRTRVVSLSADVLPAVVRLPPSLRRVADFAPARRARLGGSAIVTVLGVDEEFRERVGTQVAARAVGDADDPVELAARAWLTRPEGWETVVSDGVRRVAERARAAPAADETERLRARLADAEQAVRDLKALQRVRAEEYKRENAALRRRLGESRAAERAAREALEERDRAAADERTRVGERAAAQDKEIRRLRAQVAQGEADTSAARRATRSERDEATVRARVLLDTVLEAAAGLRRELGLPAVSGNPADRVEAALADDPGRDAAGAGARPVTPALLEQYLAMPRARLLVDGYNVTKAEWPASSLEAQRIRLLQGLAPLVARTGADTTVVFDAAASTVRPVVATPRGVKALFSPVGVIADDVLRELVAAEPPGRVLVVVTDDRAIARDVVRDGARCAPTTALRGLLAT
jgi:predicted RNA-binding protein with PIN domain